MRNQKKNKGFTLIELLIVIAIIGILAAVLIPNLLRARQVAVDRAGESYVKNVYTAAQAYMAENISISAVPTDCSGGYTAGSYTVGDWGSLATCTVEADGSSVTATWTGGVLNSGSVGN